MCFLFACSQPTNFRAAPTCYGRGTSCLQPLFPRRRRLLRLSAFIDFKSLYLCRDLASLTDSLQRPEAAGPRQNVHPETLPTPSLKTAARPNRLSAAKPLPTGNHLQDEIQALKHDYLSRGGKDSSLLEAIAALERQVLEPPIRAMAGVGGGKPNDAHVAGARAVQAVYSNQWPGASADLGMHSGGVPSSNMYLKIR